MNEKNTQRPFILEVDEAKNEIIQAINNAIRVHNLPCCIVDMILSDVYYQVKEGARNELEQVRAQEVAMAKQQMGAAQTAPTTQND